MQKDSSRRRFPLADRVIEVVDDTLTGEVLLDEALKMMKSSEKMSVNSWIDLMSGMHVPVLEYGPCDRTQADLALLSPHRRNLELDEDWIPIETSARASGQGPRG